MKISESERLHNCPFPVIGLTGGIATGKSTVSTILEENGFTVICADKLIHEIYKEKKVIDFLKQKVPGSLQGQSVVFPKLREAFFASPKLKAELETLLYAFLPQYFTQKLPKEAEYIFYDVPLLFEKKMQSKFDYIVSVLSSQETQRKRIQMRDPLTTKETIDRILEAQLPLEEKRSLSNFVIDNEGTKEELENQIKNLILKLTEIFS